MPAMLAESADVAHPPVIGLQVKTTMARNSQLNCRSSKTMRLSSRIRVDVGTRSLHIVV